MPKPQVFPDLSRKLARDEAYEALRIWIIDGTLKPGELLRDHEIAGSMSISRTPVREALRRLEDEGFVETSLNRWTRVAPLEIEKCLESYAAIEALETYAFARICERLKRSDLQEMGAANQRMLTAATLGRAVEAATEDEEFHNVFISRYGNGELFVTVSRLKLMLRRAEIAYFGGRTRALESQKEHATIVHSVQKRSLQDACNALSAHWASCADRLRILAQV